MAAKKKQKGKNARAKARRKIIRRTYGLLTVVSAFIVAGFSFYKLAVQPPKMAQAAASPAPFAAEPGTGFAQSRERKKDFYTFLLFGMDDGNGNTDTVMVGAYDVQGQALNLVSIPRDTLIETDRSNKRINAVYASEGARGLQNEISQLLGIPIDFYIQVNLKAFEKIVDTVGGVDFDVPVDMNYEDPTQNLYIHLKAGMQHLDGEKAEQLVRCRNAYLLQDIGRVSTQQQFLKALAGQTLQAGNITKVRNLAGILQEYVKTDLNLQNIVWFGEHLLSLKPQRILCQTIPYADTTASYRGSHYVTLDIDKVLTMVNSGFNPFTAPLERPDLQIMSIQDGETVFS
ncbi:MAG: LCP family protein [Oscillospiraceae bacterium]|nr:LCP family protein [Oscillospiraceae bacterium]